MVLMDSPNPPIGGPPCSLAPLNSFHLIEDLVGDAGRPLKSVCVAVGAPNIRDEMTDRFAKTIVAVMSFLPVRE